MKKLLNIYFRMPVMFDYLIGLGLVYGIMMASKKGLVIIAEEKVITEFGSETTTILLTLSGFILTFLTVLVTLKTNAIEKKGEPTLMDLFCNSLLYDDTVKLLKNCIKSLVFVTLIVYAIRLVKIANIAILYYVLVFSVVILLLTILRSLFILDSILKFHNKKKK